MNVDSRKFEAGTRLLDLGFVHFSCEGPTHEMVSEPSTFTSHVSPTVGEEEWHKS